VVVLELEKAGYLSREAEKFDDRYAHPVITAAGRAGFTQASRTLIEHGLWS
jgi:DNA-binding MarR family transcriptional regulator